MDRSCTPFTKLTFKYFMYFWYYFKWHLKFSFYHWLLLVYKNLIIFVYWPCIIQLRKIYLYFSSFCVDSLNFSMFAKMSSANKDSFTSAFLIHIPRSFTCCIAMAGTSRTMMNKNVESIYSFFFLIFLGQSISSFTFVVVLKYIHNFFYTPPLREWSLFLSPWMGAVVSDLLLMNRFW